MKIGRFFKRLLQPSSLAGAAGVVLALPAIVNKLSPEMADAIAGGLNTTASGISSGMPLWQSILIGVLGGAAIAKDDKSGDGQ